MAFAKAAHGLQHPHDGHIETTTYAKDILGPNEYIGGKYIGEQGSLLSMDIMADYVEFVSQKVEETELKNVSVIRKDAINSGLESGIFDTVILFGVVPF